MPNPPVQRIADFILCLQDAGGMIADARGSATCNVDSNIEYALTGLSAAYQTTGEARFLAGFEKGVSWLAARIDMTDPQFKGSFHYAYSTTPPYASVALSPGLGISDVGGVDACSALFVHLLALDREMTGSAAFSDLYAAQGQAALDFLLRENRSADGFFYSSWQETGSGWQLWPYENAADQGDVYLGFRAGADLYGSAHYGSVANFLLTSGPQAFCDAAHWRFGVGL